MKGLLRKCDVFLNNFADPPITSEKLCQFVEDCMAEDCNHTWTQQDVIYMRHYCVNCGATKEVVARDVRPKQETSK